MAIYQLGDLIPRIDPTAFIFDSADLIGDVLVGAYASIWANVSIRGDNTCIDIGHHSNVQEGSVLHSDAGVPLTIDHHVTIGHQAMLHGCTIGSGSLVGMQAIVLNRAKIGKNCLVGAGALVTEGKEFSDGSMILGSPAKVVRDLTPEQIEGLRKIAQHYVDNAKRFRTGLKKLS